MILPSLMVTNLLKSLKQARKKKAKGIPLPDQLALERWGTITWNITSIIINHEALMNCSHHHTLKRW